MSDTKDRRLADSLRDVADLNRELIERLEHKLAAAEELLTHSHDRCAAGELMVAGMTERLAAAEARSDAAENAATDELTCEWVYDDTHDSHGTFCGHVFQFIDGGVDENGFKYCPWCGGTICETKEVADE